MNPRFQLCRFVALLLAGCASSLSPVWAQIDGAALSTNLSEVSSAGLGFAPRVERSPYRDDGLRFDLLPLYVYEGKHLFLNANRVGVKVFNEDDKRFDLLLERRLEGFTLSDAPASLAGMAQRNTSVDVGLAYNVRLPWGDVRIEALQDANGTHKGREARLSVSRETRSGAWTWRPSVSLGWRSAKLNDYYYGVKADEATDARAAYAPGGGLQAGVGLHTTYALTRNWRLMSGVSATVLGNEVKNSPIVQQRVLPAFYLGAVYDFGPHEPDWVGAQTPTYFKALHGKATEDGCHLAKIITAQCLATAKVNPTNISAVQIGRPFIQNFKGQPIDVVGYVGLAHHEDHGLQPNGLQLDLFMKIYYTGFPWQSRVKTRLGMGMGVSLAQRVPYIEESSQAVNGEQTSRLLHYLDPSLDVSLGDLFGWRSLKDTYIGMGVSHRSGIFKSSRLLGNVDGGSNYIYSYVETVY